MTHLRLPVRSSLVVCLLTIFAACAPTDDAPAPTPVVDDQTAYSGIASLDWPRFRGPNGSGASDAAGFPVEFGPELNVAWQTEVPFGHSSPIVSGDRIYLTAASEESLITMALDRTSGDIIWRNEIAPSRDATMYRANDPASPTPVSDGTNVYAFFQEVGLVSFDADGEERWRVELGPFDNFYGLAASPLIAGDALLLLCDQADGSFLLAIDKDTGEERWRSLRPGRIESWSTPVLYPSEDPEAVLVFGSNWVDSYDLWTGEPRWELPGVGGGPVASPVVSGTMMVITAPNHAEQPPPSFTQLLTDADTDNDGALTADELGAVEGWGEHFGWMDRDGDNTLTSGEYGALFELIENTPYGTMGISLPLADGAGTPEIVWSNEQSIPYIATPVVYDDIVYLVRDGGIVQSVDLSTGEVFKRGRTSRSAGSIYASPVAADGKILISSLEGEIAVLEAGAQWEVLAVNDLDEPIYASPALAGNRIFVRTSTRLYSFGTQE